MEDPGTASAVCVAATTVRRGGTLRVGASRGKGGAKAKAAPAADRPKGVPRARQGGRLSGRGRGYRLRGQYAKKRAVAPARVKVKREGKVKRAVKVKLEPEEDGEMKKKGFGKTPLEHFCYQVKFINRMLAPPWSTCFGALGTGIVAVRSSRPHVKKEIKEEEEEEEPAAQAGTASSSRTAAPVDDMDSGDAVGDHAGEIPAVKREEDGNDGADLGDTVPDRYSIPADATLIIFVSAPAHCIQSRNGKSIGGYREELDTLNKTLVWNSQRGDKNNFKIGGIINHSRRGGRIVVGVRSGFQDRDFKLLGALQTIDSLHRARFLINDGDDIVQEVGTCTYHKCITPACLSPALKSGIGLTTARYPLRGSRSRRFCTACCYMPPRATFHFREMAEEGINAFHQSARIKKEQLKSEEEDPDDPGRAPVVVPVKVEKRLRGKQPLIKIEIEEHADDAGSTMPGSDMLTERFPDDVQPKTLDSVTIKTEPVDDEPMMAEPV